MGLVNGLVDEMCTTAAELRNSSGGVPRKDAEIVAHDVQDYAIRVLNEAFEADPTAISAMFSPMTRFLCNEELADHPTIQVRSYDDSVNPTTVGVLGLINGLLADEGNVAGAIAMMVDEDTGEITGFTRYKPKVETSQ